MKGKLLAYDATVFTACDEDRLDYTLARDPVAEDAAIARGGIWGPWQDYVPCDEITEAAAFR